MENVLLIPTPNGETGRRVLQSLDDLAAADAIEIRGAAIVERYADGRWHFPEETENVSYRGTMTSGALGALIGLLAGPAGLLLGGAAGLLIGSSVEIGDSEEIEATIHALPRLIPPGSTAVIGDVYETDPADIDRALATLGITGWRMTRADAEAQVEDLAQKAASRSSSPND